MDEKYLIVILYGIILLLCVIVVAICLYFKGREEALLNRLHKMLEEAISGTFVDKYLDESKVSALESSMWRYLCDQKLAYDTLLKQKEQIQTSISDISHQSVAPISNIMLYSELLEDTLISTGTTQDALEELDAIKEQVKKLDFLIQSVVKLSRMEMGLIQVYPQNQCIGEILLLLKQQFLPKAVQKDIVLEIQESDQYAVFDKKWTLEAISNVVDNAIKYTPNGGKISVCINAYMIFLRIDVIDNGIGISETEQANIFTRFYRSTLVSEKPGVGLGLYLTREILKAQNGYMKVSSIVGKGSTFSIFLWKGKV